METDETITRVDTNEVIEYRWFDVDDILTMEPNKETFDFIIEMLEKIIGNDDDFE
jgi:NADH pyrophosphatase NudC (nudix superfamily)